MRDKPHRGEQETKRGRLRRINRRLREEAGRYRKLFYVTAAVALIGLLAMGGYIAFQPEDSDKMVLGTGRAGLKADSVAVADTTARVASVPEAPTEIAPVEEPGQETPFAEITDDDIDNLFND